MKKSTRNLLFIGGSAIALMYFTGALGGTSSTGSAVYNPSTGTYTPGPQGFSGVGLRRIRRRRPGLNGLAAIPLPIPFGPNRAINPAHRARYMVR